MGVKVIKNRHQVEIQPIRFKTDTEFEGVIPPLPAKTFFMALVGKPASGKSTTMSALLSKRPNKEGYGFYRKQFEHVYFVMPKNSLENLPDSHPYHKHIEAQPDTYFPTLDGKTLTEIMTNAKAAALDGEKSLLVIDDEVAALKRPDVIALLQEIAANRRHYALSVCVLTQVWNTIPLVIRKMLSHAFVWRASPKEFDSIYDEAFFSIPKAEAKEVCEHAWKQDHGFVFIDLSENRFYDKSLHELVSE